MISSRVIVDGRTMTVYNSSSGRSKVGADAPHSHYCVGRSDVRTELTAVRDICRIIGSVESVLELFGGSGWHSSIIQRYCSPSRHEAWDVAEDCVASMRASLPEVFVRKTDSYQTELPTSNWVHADFNAMTFARYLSQKPLNRLIRATSQVASEWMTLTDSALFGLARFPRNRASYAALEPEVAQRWQAYYRLWAHEFDDWGLIGVWTWQSAAAMMLFRRGVKSSDWPVVKVKPDVKMEIAP